VFLGSDQMTYFTDVRSQPYSVAVVDFNNDTQLDFGLRLFALVVGDVNNGGYCRHH
jgi:hypothetical protein